MALGIPQSASGSFQYAPPAAAPASVASASSGIPSADQIMQQAHAYAAQSVANQVALIRAQQQAAITQATQRAAAIQAASLAGAKYINGLGLGTAAQNAYANAVKNETGIAQGYSGQLRTDAAAQAAAAQAQLASVPGNTQTITDRGPALANVLYGLTGAIPANVLQVAGLGAAANARALPAQAIGYGAQQAALTRGQGATTAANLTPSILSAQGQLPSIQNQYAGQLTSYANTAANLANQTAEINSLIGSRTQPKTTITGGGIYSTDPTTGKVTVVQPPPAKSPSIHGSASSGYFTVDPATGKPTFVTKGTGSKPKTLSAAARQKDIAAINQGLDNTFTGYKDPKTGVSHPALDRTGALSSLIEHGYFATPELAKISMAALNRKYGKPVKIGPTGSFGFQAVG